ncbi:MAG: DNA-3-methyladenine glycosylase [Candidatus Bathyarchaeia archaeon]
MVLAEVGSFQLKTVSPYSFKLTFRKPAGWWWSTPYETFEKGVLWSATRRKRSLVGLKFGSTGPLQNACIRCSVYSRKKMGETELQELRSMLQRSLRTQEDLTEFYAMCAKDSILRDTAERLCGMHTVSWPELFTALILAVTLQMAPMKRSNQMMNLLIENFGEEARFDGKNVRYWPSTERIAEANVAELRAKAKLGYRAENLVAIAQSLNTGFPTMDELYAMEPSEAKKQLLTLRGIGDYSAELVMPGMGFPLDVWSAKIFSVLFHGKEPGDPRAAIPSLKEEAENRWGKWRGYAFVYVLNDLPSISKHVGVDLTRF